MNMDKSKLELLIEEGLTTKSIAENMNTSQTSIMYWLNKFNLSTRKNNDIIKWCPRCKNKKNRTEFYNRRNQLGSSAYCVDCTNKQTTERNRKAKILAVEYKGCRCEKCGYNKCIAALDFHHIDPTIKKFEIGGKKFIKLNKKITDELDKCSLLCANCHRESHASIADFVS